MLLLQSLLHTEWIDQNLQSINSSNVPCKDAFISTTINDSDMKSSQENLVLCWGLRHDTTRQKPGLVVIRQYCNAKYLRPRPFFASYRRPSYITRFRCCELSCLIVSCDMRWP